MVKTRSTPPPLHAEQQPAALELRFPGKHNKERGGQLLCPGLENTLRSHGENAYSEILFLHYIFSDYPAAFLRLKIRNAGYGPSRSVNQYIINTGGASNINFKRVKNK